MEDLKKISDVGAIEVYDGIASKKELALNKAGATREVAYKAYVEGLGAEVMTLDKFGGEHFAPDHSNRLRAAELISKLNGDLKTDNVIENKIVNISVGRDSVNKLMEMVADVSKQLEMLRNNGQQTGEIIDITVS